MIQVRGELIGEFAGGDREQTSAQLRQHDAHRFEIAGVDQTAAQAQIVGNAARHLEADDILPQDDVA